MNYYELAQADRAAIKAWVDDALSATVRSFRLQSLGQSFGLPVRFLEAYLAKETSMGHGLRAEIIAWCNDNPNVSPNEPVDDVHWLANLGDLG